MGLTSNSSKPNKWEEKMEYKPTAVGCHHWVRTMQNMQHATCMCNAMHDEEYKKPSWQRKLSSLGEVWGSLD